MAISGLPPPPEITDPGFKGWLFQFTQLAAAVSASLQAANNLSDLASASTARTNLGLGSLATVSNLTGPITSTGAATAVSSQTGTGSKFVMDTSPTLVTPVIGAATGTSLAATGAITSSGTAGIGYTTGAGGTVTQGTNKSTSVTLNKICGTVLTSNAALGAGAKVSFSVSNSVVAAADGVFVWVASSSGSANNYRVSVAAVAFQSFNITLENITAGSLSDAVTIGFAVIKAVTA